MNKQSIIIGISIVMVAVIGLIVFRSSGQEIEQPVDNQPEATTTDENSGVVRTVDGLHQYNAESGRHIVAGTTTVPTPCHQLSTETEVRESSPEQVVISFSADKENGDQMCAQVIQNRRFKVSFEASESANIIGGMFNGYQVELNLREVRSDENLDDFQIYTKG